MQSERGRRVAISSESGRRAESGRWEIMSSERGRGWRVCGQKAEGGRKQKKKGIYGVIVSRLGSLARVRHMSRFGGACVCVCLCSFFIVVEGEEGKRETRSA